MSALASPLSAIAVPAAGAGIEALAALLLIVSFVVLLGLSMAWRSTIGWALVKLADLLDAVSVDISRWSVRPFGSVSAALRAISHNVGVAIAYAALKCENGAVWLFDQAANQLKWIGHEIADLADDVARSVTDLITVEIPGAVRSRTRPIAQRLHGIDRVLGRLEAQAKAQWARLHAGIDRLTRVVTHTIPARLGRIEANAAARARRLTRVEKLLAAGTFTALVATALRRLRLGFLRCSNFRRAGRVVCGMDSGLLDDLLGVTLLIVGTVSIVEMAEDLQKIVDPIVDGVQGFVREA